MKAKIFLFSLASLMSFNLSAASYKTVTVNAQGETLDQAIDVGLRRAVEQISGVSIESSRSSLTTYSAKNESAEAELNLVDGTFVATKGGDVKYRILSEECGNNGCRVQLEVDVAVDPKENMVDPNANRRTIAIAQFSGARGQSISNKLKDLIVQDRKFKVLNAVFALASAVFCIKSSVSLFVNKPVKMSRSLPFT